MLSLRGFSWCFRGWLFMGCRGSSSERFPESPYSETEPTFIFLAEATVLLSQHEDDELAING